MDGYNVPDNQKISLGWLFFLAQGGGGCPNIFWLAELPMMKHTDAGPQGSTNMRIRCNFLAGYLGPALDNDVHFLRYVLHK